MGQSPFIPTGKDPFTHLGLAQLIPTEQDMATQVTCRMLLSPGRGSAGDSAGVGAGAEVEEGGFIPGSGRVIGEC